MTNDELDRLAGIKIMGFHEDFIAVDPDTAWQPTRRIEQAFECIAQFKDSFWLLKHQASYPIEKRYYFRMDFRRDDIELAAPTAPEAIVKACLKAKGIEI